MCPLCKGEKSVYFGEPIINSVAGKFIRNDYKIVRCSSCSFYYVSPGIDFTAEEWRELYSVGYFGLPPEWLNKKRKEEIRARIDLLEKSIDKKDVNFLDVGCGEGLALMASQKKGWALSAVDITDHRFDEAKLKEIKFYLGNIFELNLPEETYDVLYFDSVLEHVTNPFESLNELVRIMKTNGVIYIGVPNEDSLFNKIKKLVYIARGQGKASSTIPAFTAPYHIGGFNRHSLNYLLEKVGLEIVDFKIGGRKFDFLSFHFGTKDYFQALLMLPFEFLGWLFGMDVYLMLVARKIVKRDN